MRGLSSSSLRLEGNGIGPTGVELRLLECFELIVGGEPVRLQAGAQRLVAFVALHARPVRRAYAAGTLWPDTTDDRAAANLRSTLWRIPGRGRLLEAGTELVALRPDVLVDLREAERCARQLDRSPSAEPPSHSMFAADLLPGWYDDWVLIERERFRQLRLRALEALCERHVRAGRIGKALDAALLSVAGEPLRESAHRAVVRAHLADGNVVEALRQYELCRTLLGGQLGLEPSEQMQALVAGLDALETKR